MFASPRGGGLDINNTVHSGIRDKLFAKYKSPSPKKKKKKNEETKRSSVYGDRTSANADTFFVHDLENSHKGYHSEEKKKLYFTQHGLDNPRKVRSAPRRRGRFRRRKASLLGMKGNRELGEQYNREIMSRKHRIHDTKPADVSTSPPTRHRIHQSKAALLGFTGDEKLHQEYESHRIEHRGGTHDIVDYDGHGHFNTWGDARNYTNEEQVAVGAADDRSYYERFGSIEHRFDAELLNSMVDENLRQRKTTTRSKQVRRDESRKVLGELKQRLRGFAYALRESFQALDTLGRSYVTRDQFISALRSMAITLSTSKKNALFHHFDPNDLDRIEYEPIVKTLCGSSKRKNKRILKSPATPADLYSPPRHRIHQPKAALLGFTGDEKLHQAYEKHRIEHRGGTHDIVDYDGHGHFNTWGDARNYTTEEQVAIGAADDRSYYERFAQAREDFDDTIDPVGGHLKGRLDLSMLNNMLGLNAPSYSPSSSSSSPKVEKKKKKKKKKNIPPRRSPRPGPRIHRKKAELLGFTGNENLHKEYEKQRIDHRGGTHDIVDYDGHGHFNTWADPRNYTIEEQLATGTADDRSYYQKNRRRTAVKVPSKVGSGRGRLSGDCVDMDLLNKMMSS